MYFRSRVRFTKVDDLFSRPCWTSSLLLLIERFDDAIDRPDSDANELSSTPSGRDDGKTSPSINSPCDTSSSLLLPLLVLELLLLLVLLRLLLLAISKPDDDPSDAEYDDCESSSPPPTPSWPLLLLIVAVGKRGAKMRRRNTLLMLYLVLAYRYTSPSVTTPACL
jgi:hypothetical protein